MRIVTVGNSSYRWVEIAPGLRFEVRRLTLEEQNRLFGGKSSANLKSTKEYISLALRAWEGVGKILGSEVDPPCNAENKLMVLEWFVEGEDGEKSPLWTEIQKKLDEQDTIDLKN